MKITKDELLRKVYSEIESGTFFKAIAMKGEVRNEDTNEQTGEFLLKHLEMEDGTTVPIIIFSLEDRYQIYCPMYEGFLAEWIRAGSTGGYHGMEPLGEMGTDDYISRTKLHGPIKRAVVENFPLYVK